MSYTVTIEQFGEFIFQTVTKNIKKKFDPDWTIICDKRICLFCNYTLWSLYISCKTIFVWEDVAKGLGCYV